MDYSVNLTMYNQEPCLTDIAITKGDFGAGRLVISVPDDTRGVKLFFKLPSGSTVERDSLVKNADGTYSYTFQKTELSCVGNVVADVKFYDSNSRESSQKFIFKVISDTISDNFAEEIEQSDTFQKMVSDIQKLKNEFEDSLNKLIAEKLAIDDNNISKLTTYSSDKIQGICDNKVDKSAIVHNADVSDADKIAGMDLVHNMNQQITAIKNRLWTGIIYGTAQQTLLSYIPANLDNGGVVSFPDGVFTDIPIDGWGVAEVVRFDALIWAVTIHYSNVSTTYYNQIYVDKWVWDTWIEK